MLLWTISGIYFAFNQIELVRGEQYRLPQVFSIDLSKINLVLDSVKSIQVGSGYDVADDHIVKLVEANDLVITADIPLASEVIEKGGMALNPRGELYTLGNIKTRLNMRDFMDTMRSSGLQIGGGPPPLSQKDRMAFANALDRYIATHQNNTGKV